MQVSKGHMLFRRSGLSCQVSSTPPLRTLWPRKFTSSQVFQYCHVDWYLLSQRCMSHSIMMFPVCRDQILGVHRAECHRTPKHRETWSPLRRSESGGCTTERKRQSVALQWRQLLEVSYGMINVHLFTGFCYIMLCMFITGLILKPRKSTTDTQDTQMLSLVVSPMMPTMYFNTKVK